MTTVVELPLSLPGLRAVRWSADAGCAGIKERLMIGRAERGRRKYTLRGTVWKSAPGSIEVMQPGDVHRDIELDGPSVSTIVTLPEDVIERVHGETMFVPHFDIGDPRADALHRLVDAATCNADRLTLDVALVEAVNALALVSHTHSPYTRPVRHALEYLRERLAEPVSLDDLAAYAERDKFYLCRACRAQVGMPPHAYLTHLRVARAKCLLADGKRPSEVATTVGFYDQAQLTRHFRRIANTTPARYRSS